MSKAIQLHKKAPDFILDDYQGNEFRLSDHFGQVNIVLIFNRGFL